jgi:ketosteroid isomerase-like protein
MSGIDTARSFIEAVQGKDADAAASLCAEDVEVLLPGAEFPLRGREGVRQMIRMAPDFVQSMREAEESDGEVRIITLTRAPGLFANYTTWKFVTQDDHVKRLSFDLKGAN